MNNTPTSISIQTSFNFQRCLFLLYAKIHKRIKVKFFKFMHQNTGSKLSQLRSSLATHVVGDVTRGAAPAQRGPLRESPQPRTLTNTLTHLVHTTPYILHIAHSHIHTSHIYVYRRSTTGVGVLIYMSYRDVCS